MNAWLGSFENIRDFCMALRSMNWIKPMYGSKVYELDQALEHVQNLPVGLCNSGDI